MKLPAPISQVVIDHSKWLMRKLYNSRDKNGDVVFVFEDGEALPEQIEIPKPEHEVAKKEDQPKLIPAS